MPVITNQYKKYVENIYKVYCPVVTGKRLQAVIFDFTHFFYDHKYDKNPLLGK